MSNQKSGYTRGESINTGGPVSKKVGRWQSGHWGTLSALSRHSLGILTLAQSGLALPVSDNTWLKESCCTKQKKVTKSSLACQVVAGCPQAGSPGKWVRLLEVSGSACFAHQHPVVVGEGSGTYLVVNVGPLRHWKE